MELACNKSVSDLRCVNGWPLAKFWFLLCSLIPKHCSSAPNLCCVAAQEPFALNLLARLTFNGFRCSSSPVFVGGLAKRDCFDPIALMARCLSALPRSLGFQYEVNFINCLATRHGMVSCPMS